MISENEDLSEEYAELLLVQAEFTALNQTDIATDTLVNSIAASLETLDSSISNQVETIELLESLLEQEHDLDISYLYSYYYSALSFGLLSTS